MNTIRLSAAALTAALAACSGGGAARPNVVPPVAGQAAASGARAAATFTIQIPLAGRTTGSAQRKAAYFSANTASFTVQIVSNNGQSYTGQQPGAINTGPSMPNCTSNGTTLTCTGTIDVPVGSDVLNVTATSGANNSGAPLSMGQVVAQISGTAANAITVTLDGVVAGVKVAFPATQPAPGSAQTIPVTISAVDCSGATIVGPGNYTVPITLTNTDKSGSTIAFVDDGDRAGPNGNAELGRFECIAIRGHHGHGPGELGPVRKPVRHAAAEQRAVPNGVLSAASGTAVSVDDAVRRRLLVDGCVPAGVAASPRQLAAGSSGSGDHRACGQPAVVGGRGSCGQRVRVVHEQRQQRQRQARDLQVRARRDVRGDARGEHPECFDQAPGAVTAAAITDLAVDPAGNIFIVRGSFVDSANHNANSDLLEFPAGNYTTPSTVYHDANNNVLNGPSGMGVDGSDDIFVANAPVNNPVAPGYVFEFPAGSAVRSLTLPTDAQGNPQGATGFGFDGAGHVYVGLQQAGHDPSVAIYPIASFPTAPTGGFSFLDSYLSNSFYSKNAIGADSLGYTYASSLYGVIDVFAPGASGSATPIASFQCCYDPTTVGNAIAVPAGLTPPANGVNSIAVQP